MDDLLFRGQRMDQRDRDADAIQGIQRLDGLRDVRHAQSDGVALLHAVGLEGCGDGQDVVMHRVECRRSALEHVSGVARQTVAGRFEHFIHGLVRVRDVHLIVIDGGVVLGKERIDCRAEAFRIGIIAAVELCLREGHQRALLRIGGREIADPVLRELVVLHGLEEQRRSLDEAPERVAVVGDSVLTVGVVQVVFQRVVIVVAFAGRLLEDVRHGDHRLFDGVLEDETFDRAGKGTHVGVESRGRAEVLAADIDGSAGAVVSAVQFPQDRDDVEFLFDAPHGEGFLAAVAVAVVAQVHGADGSAVLQKTRYEVFEIGHAVGAVAVDAEKDALLVRSLPELGRQSDVVICHRFERGIRFFFKFLSGYRKRTPRDFAGAEFSEVRIDRSFVRH